MRDGSSSGSPAQKLPFLPDGSPVAPLLLGRDWAATSLGPPTGWSRALRGAVTLMMDTAVPMWLAWGADLAMVYNEPYAALLGGKHPAAMGAPLQEVWPEVWPDVQPLVASALAGEALYREDLPLLVDRGGEPEQAWFSFSYSPLREDDGTVRGLLCTVWETTGKVQSRRRLDETVSRLEALTQATSHAVYRMSPDWREMLALNGQGVLADTSEPSESWPADYIHPDDRAQVSQAVERAIQSRGKFELEHRVIQSDGSLGWTLSRAFPLLGESGEIVEWFGSAADVTERKQNELALQESERQFKTLFESIDEGFCVIEFLDGPHGPMSDYVHIAANPAYLANAGIADVVGQRVREMVPDEAEGWVQIYRQVLLSGEPVRFERELVRTGRYLELSAFRVEPVERRQVAVLFLDITKRRQAELALRELNDTLERRVTDELAERLRAEEALRQAQKMEAVGQLTGGIAHDFNNMLTVVLGSLDLLARRFVTEESHGRRYVDAARDGVKRATQLTQRLLAFSRQQPLKPEQVDVNKLVAGMSELLRHSLGGAIRLETVLAGGLWRAHADPNQLENVILNLAINGRDAMPEGGKLTVETANCHLDDRYAAAHAGVLAGQYVMVAVSDIGSGMTADTMSKAFDPFFTTKEVGRGTGLGLSQVYGFVKQSGGHVKIYSEVGEGTVVKVYLPRLAGALAAADEAQPASRVPVDASQAMVLVVEDEPAVRQFSVDALIELGYQVVEADGAKAALKLLDAHPGIALLFTDVVMPEVNGRKLADEAVRRRPGLKVLFTTGYTRNAVVHNGVLDPGVHLIGKPFSIEELAQSVREVLDSPD